MARIVTLGDTAIDQFPVWDSDGYTKKSGETVFTCRLWKDGSESPVVPAISEIGTSGEYGVSFVPDAVGVWVLEIIPEYNNDVWTAEFVVEPADLRCNASMSDDAAVATLALWFEQAGAPRMDLDSIAAVIKDSAGNTEVDLGANNTPTAEGVFTFSTASSNLTENVSYTIVATATRGTLTWTAIVGFSKV